MAKVTILNTDDLQGVFVAAEEAKNAANDAATKAFAAAQAAAEAAGRVASFDELLPAVLAILRAEIGSGVDYLPRGPWLATESYKKKDLVSFTLSNGSIRSFIATADPPVGTPPTDTGFWGIYGETPTETSPHLKLAANVGTDAPLSLAPGESAAVQLTLTAFFTSETEFVFEVTSDEPGISGSVALEPLADDALSEETVDEDDALGQGASRPVFYTLTVNAAAATPEGPHSVTVSARAKTWQDSPEDPNFGLRSDATTELVVATVGVEIAPNPTAVYRMSSPGYELADFLEDDGPNGLTLVRKGDVRPNSRGDGWVCEGTPGSVLHTPPLTGHAMNAAQELGFIISDPKTLTPGTVVAALASTTRQHDYTYAYTTAEGLKLRVAKQNAAGTGADTVDSEALAYDGGTRFSLSVDPTTQAVRVQRPSGRSVAVSLPAWPASGVRASFYGVIQADNTVLLPSAGEVLASTPHKAVLTPIRRDRNAQWLAANCTARAVQDERAEYPKGTRLILAMQPGEETKDRTFYNPGNHDLTLLGDAAPGDEGGIVTSGAVGSAARTGWLTDVTWDASFTAAFSVERLFDEPRGISYLALNSENNENVWIKLIPQVSNNSYDVLFAVLSEPGPSRTTRLTVGNLSSHLFLLRYDAAKRTVSLAERNSGKSSDSVPVFDTYSGRIGLTLGGGFFGKTVGDSYRGLKEETASRHSGVWFGTKLYSATEEKAALDALGVAAAELVLDSASAGNGGGAPGIPTGGPSVPDPDNSSLIGAGDFSAENLGAGELRNLYDTRIKPGFLFLPNDKRKNKIGDHIPWDKSYASRYEIKTHNGKSYRSYTGPDCGVYFMGRGTAKICYTIASHAFRATKDLRILDVACAEVKSLMEKAKDESGINSDKPDGFLGFAYGSNGQRQLFFAPDDPRNTARVRDGRIEYFNSGQGGNGSAKKLTGIETQLEEGLMIAWMVTALAAHQNVDKFSPTYEPPGNRPATPQYYRTVRDLAVKVYEDTCAKWDQYFQGSRESELPLNIRRSLAHALLNEIASKVGYAKIKGGADWKNHSAYKEAQRAWKLAFGPLERVGAQKNVQLANWHIATHPRWGKCLFWAHRAKRFEPGGTKDGSGEYVSRNLDKNFVHPNDYTDHDYGAMIFMHEEGAEFVTREWLSMIGNTVMATMTLGNKFERNGSYGPVPYTMNGGNQVAELESPWGASRSTNGSSSAFLTDYTVAGFAAYTEHYEAFKGLITDSMGRFGERPRLRRLGRASPGSSQVGREDLIMSKSNQSRASPERQAVLTTNVAKLAAEGSPPQKIPLHPYGPFKGNQKNFHLRRSEPRRDSSPKRGPGGGLGSGLAPPNARPRRGSA